MAAVSARQHTLNLDELRDNALRACRANSTLTQPDHRAQRRWQANPASAQIACGFSEISLQDFGSGCLLWLAPLLRELSHDPDQRWLTLLDPPPSLNLRWLREAGLDARQLRVIRSKPDMDSAALRLELLASGLNHTLISWSAVAPEQRQTLEYAALSGRCRSLNILLRSTQAA